MPRKVAWEFAALGEDFLPDTIVALETSDVFVLWRLSVLGPMSVGDFFRLREYSFFPVPEKIPFTRKSLQEEFSEKPFTIDRTSLLDTLKRLSIKNMIAPIDNNKRSKVFCLTPSGLIWFFYHFWNQDAFKLFYENYCKLKQTPHMSKGTLKKVKALEEIFPVLKIWDKVSKEEPNALQNLEKAICKISSYNQIEALNSFIKCTSTKL